MTYEAVYEQVYGDMTATAADAWNIFDTNWDTNNSEDVLTTIYRRDKSSLDMFDFKISNDDLFQPAG